MTVKKLTDKQQLFCKEYLIDLNGTQAAIRAGYSENTAQEISSENLSKPLIQEYLTELKAEREQKLEINAQWVLNQAVKVHNMTLQDKDHTNALKALDLIGKHVNIGAFNTKMDINHSHVHSFITVADKNILEMGLGHPVIIDNEASNASG
jgi:phage terminase small subunit